MSILLVLLALTIVSKPSHDPCALLQPGEIQALAPKDKLVPGKLDTTAANIGSIACSYEWGNGGNAATGHHYLNVILMDAAKTFPGTSPNLIIEGMMGGSHDPNTISNPLPGIGEAAMYQSKSPINAQATAYAKGSVLQVTFESPDARARKDQVIGLLKSAIPRL